MKKLIALLIVTGILVSAGIGCSGTTTTSKPAEKETKEKKEKT